MNMNMNMNINIMMMMMIMRMRMRRRRTTTTMMMMMTFVAFLVFFRKTWLFFGTVNTRRVSMISRDTALKHRHRQNDPDNLW
jgi:hypothetical protein